MPGGSKSLYKKGDVFKFSQSAIESLSRFGFSKTVQSNVRMIFGDNPRVDDQITTNPEQFELVEPCVFKEQDFEYV